MSVPSFELWDDEDWAILFGERAAVLEFCEGLDRAHAEALARVQIEQQKRQRKREETMRAILIDPEKRTLSEIQVGGDDVDELDCILRCDSFASCAHLAGC